MGIHTGEPSLSDEGYVGSEVHLGARISVVAWGGQVLKTAQRQINGGPCTGVDLEMDRWQYGDMAKVKTTLSLDEELMRYIRVRAARTGKTQSHVLEEALRKGLGAIERIRSNNEADEEEALVLASKAVHDVRSEGRKR